LDDPKSLIAGHVSVEPPAQPLVERLSPIYVGHRDDDHLEFQIANRRSGRIASALAPHLSAAHVSASIGWRACMGRRELTSPAALGKQRLQAPTRSFSSAAFSRGRFAECVLTFLSSERKSSISSGFMATTVEGHGRRRPSTAGADSQRAASGYAPASLG